MPWVQPGACGPVDVAVRYAHIPPRASRDGDGRGGRLDAIPMEDRLSALRVAQRTIHFFPPGTRRWTTSGVLRCLARGAVRLQPSATVKATIDVGLAPGFTRSHQPIACIGCRTLGTLLCNVHQPARPATLARRMGWMDWHQMGVVCLRAGGVESGWC